MVLHRILSGKTLQKNTRRRQDRGQSRRGLAEYAVLDADGRPAGAARSRELLVAYRWLAAAREQAPTAATELHVGRRTPRTPWRRCEQVLTRPVLTPDDAPLDPTALARTQPLAVAPREARARVRALLLRGGLGTPEAASLLRHHAGYFPSVEVGTAQILHTRLGAAPAWLAWIDLRALLWDLIASATLWTLHDAGDARCPPGVHIFAA